LLSAFCVATSVAQAADRDAVVTTYADIALAAYSDSLTAAQQLQTSVDALIAAPSETTLAAARSAWLAARDPYMQTEVFRFGNPIVDDWEGAVNAWPLDEGLIDYVAPDYFGSGDNPQAQLNVIANPTFSLSGRQIDAKAITPDLLRDVLQEADGNEANVATGYHAIEFLLWGQDLVSDAPGAGDRPYTDFVTGPDCTNGHCDRRAQYLSAAADLLVSDLDWMVGQWTASGAARAALLADPTAGLGAMLSGMGNLSFGEMAGQRVKLGLILHDQEEEHDCFSDNTPESHYHDVLGIQNVWLGRYLRRDGSTVAGPSLRDLVAGQDAALADSLTAEIAATLAATDALRVANANGMSYDMLLGVGNPRGEELLNAVIDGLVAQSRSIERVSGALDLAGVVVEGDDTLGGTGDVFE
jgi:putative iron-regulated protein